MGASLGAVAFQVDTAEYDLSKVVADLFGNEFQPTNEICDTRKFDCIYIGKTKDFIVIVNTGLADQFFASTSTSTLGKYLTYFSNPGFVFAFEECDSGGTYSYSLIYNGRVKRQLRSVSYSKETDFGVPEPKELKWLQAETKTEDGVTLYKDSEGAFTMAADDLPQIMLQDIMLEKLGFTSWNMDDLLLDKGRYKRQPLPNKLSNAYTRATGYKRPWWKFW